LPNEIGNLINLRKLGLSENSLTSLPDSLAALNQLETLDLRHNRLCEVDFYRFLLDNNIDISDSICYLSDRFTRNTLAALQSNRIDWTRNWQIASVENDRYS
jgi:hypothetical protein